MTCIQKKNTTTTASFHVWQSYARNKRVQFFWLTVYYYHYHYHYCHHRRHQFARKLFKSTIQPTSSLHDLLPPPREHPSITRLRVPSKFPRIHQNQKYQSFFSHASPTIRLHNCVFFHCIYCFCVFVFVFAFYNYCSASVLLPINDYHDHHHDYCCWHVTTNHGVCQVHNAAVVDHQTVSRSCLHTSPNYDHPTRRNISPGPPLPENVVRT